MGLPFRRFLFFSPPVESTIRLAHARTPRLRGIRKMAIVMQQVERKHCQRCRGKSGKETFFYMHGQYKYDIDRARELVQDGREPVEVEEDSVQASVDECDLDDFHLAHVDPSIPGI